MKNNDISIRVGAGTCACAAGAESVIERIPVILEELGITGSLTKVGCIGMCYKEVIVEVRVSGKAPILFGDITAENVGSVLGSFLKDGRLENVLGHFKKDNPEDEYFDGVPMFDEIPFNRKQVKITLANCGYIDPCSIDEYIAAGGYKAARKALMEMSSSDIIETIKDSGLRGRGGGGFPTGIKWELCSGSRDEIKYVICNADEGDPGAFMDRSLLEGDPHSVIEGMIIAARAIGAGVGYMYVRAEYPKAVEHVNEGIHAAKAKGFLGKGIFGSDFDFELILKQGAGAFVCGEETALIASLEGKRGMPVMKPPYPVTSGLFGKPTVINNVETLGSVPRIIDRGASWYASYGSKKSKGTKTFALTGKIVNAGLIEVPMGITLREIIYDIGGGVENNGTLKGVQTGGPSGGCIPAELINTTVDYESLQAIGTIMGSGGMVVMDDTTCMVDTAKYFLQFDQFESCGKCTPCRVGTKRMIDILEKISKGRPAVMEDIDTLVELGGIIKDTSLCGLGQTAPNPVLSTIKYFKQEYEDHINMKRCPVKKKAVQKK